MEAIVALLAIVSTVALVAWFVLQRNRPEDAAEHSDLPASTTSEELYGGAKRPAGPDVSTQDPDMLGGDHRPPPAGR